MEQQSRPDGFGDGGGVGMHAVFGHAGFGDDSEEADKFAVEFCRGFGEGVADVAEFGCALVRDGFGGDEGGIEFAFRDDAAGWVFHFARFSTACAAAARSEATK